MGHSDISGNQVVSPRLPFFTMVCFQLHGQTQPLRVWTPYTFHSLSRPFWESSSLSFPSLCIAFSILCLGNPQAGGSGTESVMWGEQTHMDPCGARSPVLGDFCHRVLRILFWHSITLRASWRYSRGASGKQALPSLVLFRWLQTAFSAIVAPPRHIRKLLFGEART